MPVLSIISSSMPEVEINPSGSGIHPARTVPQLLLFIRCLSRQDLSAETDKHHSQSQCQPALYRTPATACRQAAARTLSGNEYDGYHPVRRRMNSCQLSVPSGAVSQIDGKAQVFVYNPSDNRITAREVTLLRLTSNGRSLISSNHLKPGELVVSSGVHHIKDGETVKPLAGTSGTNIGGLL